MKKPSAVETDRRNRPGEPRPQPGPKALRWALLLLASRMLY